MSSVLFTRAACDSGLMSVVSVVGTKCSASVGTEQNSVKAGLKDSISTHMRFRCGSPAFCRQTAATAGATHHVRNSLSARINLLYALSRRSKSEWCLYDAWKRCLPPNQDLQVSTPFDKPCIS